MQNHKHAGNPAFSPSLQQCILLGHQYLITSRSDMIERETVLTPTRRGSAQELQTQFAADCLVHLWGLHPAGSARVLLVGHSMGGIVARAALARLTLTPEDCSADPAPSHSLAHRCQCLFRHARLALGLLARSCSLAQMPLHHPAFSCV